MYGLLKKLVATRKQNKRVAKWERKGSPLPPPHAVKQREMRRYAAEFGLTVLVETGTFEGDMVEAMKGCFERIYSIELSEQLHAKAMQRFIRDANVTLIQGDSGVELGQLCAKLDRPALFWLDGHYSAGETARGEKDTPIYEELNHIFGSDINRHVILIDDARCFGNDADYPTIGELREFISTNRPDATVEVKDDIIRVTSDK